MYDVKGAIISSVTQVTKSLLYLTPVNTVSYTCKSLQTETHQQSVACASLSLHKDLQIQTSTDRDCVACYTAASTFTRNIINIK